MNYGYYTLGAYQGTINVNTGIGGNTPGTADVNLNGDIFVLPTGTVNAAFTTANSRLHGIVDNGGTVNMWLRNGATWTNEARNTRYGEDNEDTGSNGASHITHFYGGDTAAAAGIINQKSDKAITIDHYSGNTTVNFGTLTHNGDGVTISAAADNSAITMSGDRSGLGETEAMERLAGKLTYTAYTSGERNLDGTVKLNEGLTARSVARTGRIDFNGATGKGRLGELSESPLMMKMMAVPSALRTSAVSPAGGLIPTSLPGGVAYILGDRETMMMRGAKSAMTTSMLSWRSGMTDMNQRIGDLRLGASSGIWARTYGGKVKYDKDKTNLSDSFWGTQVEGCPFKGCLYFGLMLTPDGPKVIEYNCRFGDPETQVVLPLLESDLLTVMEATTNGTLDKTDVKFSDGAAACVILASGGYPLAYEKGKEITGLTAGQPIWNR